MALGAGGSGCKKKPKNGTSVPGGGQGGAALDPTKASAEAKKDFAAVAKRYASAKSGGGVSKGQCDQFAKDFTQTGLINAPNGQTEFGMSLSVDKDTLTIGAPGSANATGAVTVLRDGDLVFRGDFE